MGTNYYLIKNVSKNEKETIINFIKNDNYEEAKIMMPNKVHIGKSSSGWRFCFDHNNWEYFDKSIKSLKGFMKKNKIIDEYERSITFKDFWQMVEDKQLGMSHEFWQGKRVGFTVDGYDFSNSTGFC